jgi:hypothetical protein
MYGNARLTPDYARWPYREVLDDRITNATHNVEAFRQANPAPGAPTMMVRSRYACMACHQQ